MRIDLDLAREIVKKTLKMGAEEAEIYAVSSKNITSEVKKGELDLLKRSNDEGYAIRVIKDSKQGLSFSTEPGSYSTCIKTALDSAHWSEPDASIGLPEKQPLSKVEIFDPEIPSLRENDLTEMAMGIEQTAFASDSRITNTRKTSVSATVSRSIIVSSKGIEVSSDSTMITAFITVIAAEKNENRSGWDHRSCRFLNDISFQDIGTTASDRAVRLLGAKKLSPLRASVLLENHIAVDFLGILAPAFSAENIQKGKSLLSGKIGTPVAADLVDLADDPLINNLPGSRSCDAEGVPGQKKVLISNGVMQQVLYDSRTARKDNTVSTGNAVRTGLGSPPSVGVTNFILSPSADMHSRPPEELISFIERGVLVTDAMGVHTANPVSGDFSIGISGLYIEGGKIRFPFKEAVLSGNIIDLLNNIEGIGNDPVLYGRVSSPCLLVKDLDISG